MEVEDSANDEVFCTRAITGAHNAVHQPIFTCNTCQLLPQPPQSNENSAVESEGEDEDDGMTEEPPQPHPLPFCICQSCADTCHADHDVIFVGVGPSTCDCPLLVTQHGKTNQRCCVLEARSIKEARELGFDSSSNEQETIRQLNRPLPLMIPPDCTLPSVAAYMDEDGYGKMMSDFSEISNIFCIECDKSMGGYMFGAFTLPTLAKNENMCQTLIRQAEVLVGESKETFWMPAEENEQQRAWCDLEIFAREIYRYHVKSYCLNIRDDKATTPCGGAEWWVQYRAAGTGKQKAPVDLHYDKDEVLAEKFGLGSFPTISTVTYLTGRGNDNSNSDNEPTVIFSHVYDDDEDRAIEMMLLSHAFKGKHIAFDGRLLHGAPSNASLQIQNTDTSTSSSLRVTFLVNVWLTGKPAGVDILPDATRSKVIAADRAASKEVSDAIPLEFIGRHVSKFTVPASDDVEYSPIILPFVSSGATWIEESGGGVDDDDDGEKEELVLNLPQFATPEYIEKRPDTALFTFEDCAAWLLRDGGEDVSMRERDDSEKED